MPARVKLIAFLFLVILAAIGSVFLADDQATDAPDRNVPGATTGPGQNSLKPPGG